MGTDARLSVGIVSPKCLNSNDARAGDRVWSGSVRSFWLSEDRQDDFEVLEGSPTGVRCFVGVGREADWVP